MYTKTLFTHMNNTLVYLQNDIENRERRSVSPFFYYWNVLLVPHYWPYTKCWLILCFSKKYQSDLSASASSILVMAMRTCDDGRTFVQNDKRDTASLDCINNFQHFGNLCTCLAWITWFIWNNLNSDNLVGICRTRWFSSTKYRHRTKRKMRHRNSSRRVWVSKEE